MKVISLLLTWTLFFTEYHYWLHIYHQITNGLFSLHNKLKWLQSHKQYIPTASLKYDIYMYHNTVNQKIFSSNKFSRLAESTKIEHMKIRGWWKIIRCTSLLHFLFGSINRHNNLFDNCIWIAWYFKQKFVWWQFA